MKKSIIIAIFTISFLLFTGFRSDENKIIIGTWVNTPSYERSGKMLGFEFKKNGQCREVGIPNLKLETWKIEGPNLIIEGVRTEDDGTTSKYHSVKPIVILNKDTLQVLDKVKGVARYTYINTKHLEKLVKEGRIVKGGQ